MRSVLQALILKTFLSLFLLFNVSLVSGDSTDSSVMNNSQWNDGPFEAVLSTREHLEEQSTRKYHLKHVMKAYSPTSIHQDFSANYPKKIARLILILQKKINTKSKCLSRFTAFEPMWTSLLLLIALRVFFKCNISFELQFISLIFVQMKSSTATEAPSLAMTSSSHVTPVTFNNAKTDAVSGPSNYYYRGECDLGWYQFGKYCYLPANELKTFDHAQRACVYHNANLLSISSKEENAIAFNISKRFLGLSNRNFLWIGMERRKATRRLHWIDGVDLKYQNWIVGEPDSNGACVQMIHQGLWEDTNCYHKMPFICKKQGSYPLPYSRSTELGIMVGIPFVFVFIVLTFVGVLIFKSIKDADDTFFGYGKNRNKEKMHAALVDLSTSIAHVSSQASPPERNQVITKKPSRSNSASHSVSSSHVNPAIEVSEFGSQSPIRFRKESGNGRAALDNNNKEKSDPEEIEMQVCVSSLSIEREDPLETSTSLDHLVTLKPKSRRLKGLKNPEATVRPPGKEGMYRLKTYV